MNFDIGTWYFDKYARCYVQVVAGVQHEAYVTVAGYQPTVVCSVRREDLDHNRSRRIDSMVGPVPVELQEDESTETEPDFDNDDAEWEARQEEKQMLHDEMINDKLIEDGRWG